MIRTYVKINNALAYLMTAVAAIWTEKLVTLWDSIHAKASTLPGSTGSADLVMAFAAPHRMPSKITTPLAKVHCETVQCGTSTLLLWNRSLRNILWGCGINCTISANNRAGETNFNRFQEQFLIC
jgi:hypothetical protein